jgi:hypothetical protein
MKYQACIDALAVPAPGMPGSLPKTYCIESLRGVPLTQDEEAIARSSSPLKNEIASSA